MDIYTDKKASIPDLQKQAEDFALYRPIQMFVLRLGVLVDQQPHSSADLDCAQSMIKRWAIAKALLRQPKSFPAVRQRARFAIGLNIIAIKLRAAGSSIDPEVTGWLRSLSLAAVKDFQTRADKNKWIDNLYVWSGVNAASSAVLTPNTALQSYAEEVWRKALAQIAQDGSLKSELVRGKRAILYHQYYLSGLLMLKALRTSLGDDATQTEINTLKLLANFITSALCDPASIAKKVDGENQEMPPPYQYSVPAAFGGDILNKRWYKCVAIPTPMLDSGFGGDMKKAAAIVVVQP